jgi:putative ABC transport system substrate-binding protein
MVGVVVLDPKRGAMRRRQLITLLGGAAIAWPLGASAQPSDRMRRVGVLSTLTADDPEGQARVAVFREALQAFGWADGRNLQIDVRWSAADAGGLRSNAADLAGHAT